MNKECMVLLSCHNQEPRRKLRRRTRRPVRDHHRVLFATGKQIEKQKPSWSSDKNSQPSWPSDKSPRPWRECRKSLAQIPGYRYHSSIYDDSPGVAQIRVSAGEHGKESHRRAPFSIPRTMNQRDGSTLEFQPFGNLYPGGVSKLPRDQRMRPGRGPALVPEAEIKKEKTSQMNKENMDSYVLQRHRRCREIRENTKPRRRSKEKWRGVKGLMTCFRATSKNPHPKVRLHSRLKLLPYDNRTS